MQKQTSWTQLIYLVIAVICYAIAVAGWFNFPEVSLLLPIIILLLSVHICKAPTAWLLWLPTLVVVLNLAPVTGRFIFTEFDMVTLALIGSLFVAYRNNPIEMPNKQAWLYICFVVLSLLVTPISWSNLLSPQTQNPYYDLAYGYKAVKGLLFALPIGYFFSVQLAQSKTEAINKLGIGSAIAAFSVFIIILWERQTLATIVEFESMSKLVSSLFNLSTSYRVTSLMADMHTGGESLDGIYLTLLAFNLFAFSFAQSKVTKTLTIIGLCATLYCIMVGFTRATYVSAFVTIAAFYTLKHFPTKRKLELKNLVLASLIIISALPLYNYSGYISAISLVLIFFAKELIQLLSKIWDSKLLAIPIFLLAVLLSAYGHLSNIWVTPTTTSIVLVITIASILSIATWLLDIYKAESVITLAQQNKTIVILVAVGLSIMFGGSRIQQRLETINQDIDTRLTHWSSVLASSDGKLHSNIFGNGWGSFPRNYVASYPELVEQVGSFTINEESLVLGAGKDLAIGQRLAILPGQTYNIDIELATTVDTPLSFMLCERNLIIFDRWAIKCSYLKQNFSGSDEKQQISFEINSKDIGQGSILTRWPTVFIIRNYGSDQPVEINKLQVSDRFGHGLLSNPDFNSGLDNWFFYHDFEHLPWHIKNIFLSFYYQIGLVGSLLFAAMLAAITVRHFRVDDTREQTILCLTLVAGMLTFGFFGDPLDSARVSSIFFAVIYMALNSNRQPQLSPK